jgi:hypothetical protein
VSNAETGLLKAAGGMTIQQQGLTVKQSALQYIPMNIPILFWKTGTMIVNDHILFHNLPKHECLSLLHGISPQQIYKHVSKALHLVGPYIKVEDGETWIANSHDTEEVLKLTTPITVLDNAVIGVTAASEPTDMFHFLEFNVDTASSISTRALELGGSGKLSIHNKGLEVRHFL